MSEAEVFHKHDLQICYYIIMGGFYYRDNDLGYLFISEFQVECFIQVFQDDFISKMIVGPIRKSNILHILGSKNHKTVSNI